VGIPATSAGNQLSFLRGLATPSASEFLTASNNASFGIRMVAGCILAGWSQPTEDISYEMDFFQKIGDRGSGNPCAFDFSTNAFVRRIRDHYERQGLSVF
jgi:hypothetical protein